MATDSHGRPMARHVASDPAGVNTDVPAIWAVDRSRPLCAYPKVARYKGSGDIEKAENFVCQ